MKLIVGLGNPGDRYAGTRHNVGWDCIDELAERFMIKVSEREHKGIVGKGFYQGEKIILLKPVTFMNLSGESVYSAANYYNIEPEDIIVIYDDINLEPGHIRVRKKGSAGSHNGMKNIILNLGSQDFPRVRIGVGAKPEGADLANWVLGHFPKELQEAAKEGITLGAKATNVILSEGVEAAMNLFNGL